MKLKKIFAGLAVSAMALTSLTVAASANEAFLMYTDQAWGWGVWDAASCPGTTDVTGDGTYTVYIDNSGDYAKVKDEDTGDLVPAVANGATVFCVDIEGLANDNGFGKDAEGYADCETGADKMAFTNKAGVEITDMKITTYSEDGTTTDIPVDLSKLIYGDIEGNGKMRIEIRNEYGDTVKDPPIDTSLISFDQKIEVTFTIKGLKAAASAVDSATAGDTTAATTSTKAGSPDTGIADVAAVAGIAVVAAGALVVAKKRK